MCLPFMHEWAVKRELPPVNVYWTPKRAANQLPGDSYIPFIMECKKCGCIKGRQVPT